MPRAQLKPNTMTITASRKVGGNHIIATYEVSVERGQEPRGGEYIDLHFDYPTSTPFDTINVFDYEKGEPIIRPAQSAVADQLAQWCEDPSNVNAIPDYRLMMRYIP